MSWIAAMAGSEEAAPANTWESHAAVKATDRATILVMDDDVEMTEMPAEYLAPEGFAMEVCHDGDPDSKRRSRGTACLSSLM
ncbi:MAG TPA: hypothetical protein VK604_18480 [Bryobacteraceae bacterium]|nr:hypothetical protein [Bryobacteraceae bacterium]